MALLQVEYRAPKLRGFGRSLSFIKASAQRSSIREYCLSSIPSFVSDKVPNTGEEVQCGLTRVSTQMIAKHRVDVIIRAGDFNACVKERVIVVDLCFMSNVSTSMVILYVLSSTSKEYVEDPFENAIGLDRSSLLARKRRNLLSWYSAILSCAIVLSNSGSPSCSSFKINTPFQWLAVRIHLVIHIPNVRYDNVDTPSYKKRLSDIAFEESVWIRKLTLYTRWNHKKIIWRISPLPPLLWFWAWFWESLVEMFDW